MRFTYSEFADGEGRFLSPEDLFPHKGFIDFILEYGQHALDALPQHPDEQVAQLISEMIEAGLLMRDDDGNLTLTPRMLRGIQHRAFLEIFRNLRPGVRDGHETHDPGARGERTEGTRPYQFGDPLSEIALTETLRNTIQRNAHESALRAPRENAPSKHPASLLPLALREEDFVLHNVEASTDSALIILIDLSGSMMRFGRHLAAKRIALGMHALIREKFPLDTVEFIGFASTAELIREKDIPLVMPKPITTHEWDVRVRIPMSDAAQTHPHFTNLHHALRLARARLARNGAPNKQVFLITDGQPTAHLTDTPDGPGHEILHLIYPPAKSSAQATLREALRCAQQGIRISSFALIEEYHGLEWVGFIDQLTRLVRGVSFYCTAGDLGATIMESYLSGKRTKKPLA